MNLFKELRRASEFNQTAINPVAHLKEEGESIVSQLPHQLLLDFGVGKLLFVLQLWINLPGHQEQVPPEGHTHHIHVLAAIPKCT